MRLQGTTPERVFAVDGHQLFVGPDSTSLRPRGYIPTPRDASLAGRLIRNDTPVRQFAAWAVGDFQTTVAYPVDRQTVVATAGRYIFVSEDCGRTWSRRGSLPPSSPPFGVLPSAICEQDGTLFLGEYPLSSGATPRIRRSTDRGRTWDSIELPEVRHVHAVQSDPYGGSVWVTTGDADDECRIGRLDGGAFEPVGGGDQRWRAVELAFTPSAVLWGVDCVYEDNHIFRLDRAKIRSRDPEPRAVHTVDSSVFYSATVRREGSTHVAFSTVGGGGSDSTAPDREPSTSERATVVISRTESEFTEWETLASFRKRRSVTTRLPWHRLPAANAYVFLDTFENELLVNPFNTTGHNGRILRYDTATTAGPLSATSG